MATTTGISLSAHLDRAKETVKRTDHTHLAFTHNSFTQARIADSHGQWTSSGRISVQWDGDIRWQSRATSSRRVAALCYITSRRRLSFGKCAGLVCLGTSCDPENPTLASKCGGSGSFWQQSILQSAGLCWRLELGKRPSDMAGFSDKGSRPQHPGP